MSNFSRRQTVGGLVFLAAAGWPTPGYGATVSILNGLASAFVNATFVLAGFNRNMSRAMNRGAVVWNRDSARRTQHRLLVFSEQLEEVRRFNFDMIYWLEHYNSRWSPSAPRTRPLPVDASDPDFTVRENEWREVKALLRRMLGVVGDTLRVLHAEQSDFVQTDAYEALRITLDARMSLLARLDRLPRPESTAEFAALAEAIRRYHGLYTQLWQTIRLVSRYALSLGA